MPTPAQYIRRVSSFAWLNKFSLAANSTMTLLVDSDNLLGWKLRNFVRQHYSATAATTGISIKQRYACYLQGNSTTIQAINKTVLNQNVNQITSGNIISNLMEADSAAGDAITNLIAPTAAQVTAQETISVFWTELEDVGRYLLWDITNNDASNPVALTWVGDTN